MPKASDLNSSAKRKASTKPKYISPAQLARLIGPVTRGRKRKRPSCSERTVREWCKQGLIPEADPTDGGHWRIGMPLSVQTRYKLEKRSADWPFDGGAEDFQGDWNPEMAEWLMLAQLYQQRLDQDFPVPTIAELADTLDGDRIDPADERASQARQIQDLIMRRLDNRESFSDLLLIGWVYQFWHKEQRRPTVAEIAEFMGLSRYAFYQRYTRAKLYRAFLVASNRVQASLPDLHGLDSVQSANRKTKKPTFKKLQRDYSPGHRRP